MCDTHMFVGSHFIEKHSPPSFQYCENIYQHILRKCMPKGQIYCVDTYSMIYILGGVPQLCVNIALTIFYLLQLMEKTL